MARKAAPDVAPTLEAAATAIEDTRWADAAARLIEAWHLARCGRIARALAIVDTRLPAPPPLTETTVSRREAQWHDYVKGANEDILRRLLAVPWPAHPKAAQGRVVALGEHTSPRISNALIALYRSGKYTSAAGRRLSRLIFNHLVSQNDHAATEEIDRAKDQATEAFRLGPAVLGRRKIPAPVFTDAADTALARIEKLLSSGGASNREALLAAVYESPHDDAPRIVFADVLSEEGDSRGEFITLQLQRGDAPPGRREKALLKTAGRHWFDGLDNDGAIDIELARGFPVAAKLKGPELRAPAWATVERLTFAGTWPVRGTMLLRGIRRLHRVPGPSLATLELPVEELDQLSITDYETGLETATLAPRTIELLTPHATELLARMARRLRALPIARRLEAVRLAMTFVELRHAITLAQEIGVAVEIADYWAGDYAHWRAHVTRTRLQIDWIGQGTFSESLYQSLSTVLAGLPPPRHLESVAITGLEESTSLRDRVETICNRWGVNVHLEN